VRKDPVKLPEKKRTERTFLIIMKRETPTDVSDGGLN